MAVRVDDLERGTRHLILANDIDVKEIEMLIRTGRRKRRFGKDDIQSDLTKWPPIEAGLCRMSPLLLNTVNGYRGENPIAGEIEK
jgi:hypothetical protein